MLWVIYQEIFNPITKVAVYRGYADSRLYQRDR